MGTFSLPKHYVDYDTNIGYHVSETGVGPYNPKEDFISVKAYYQWVPFVLFLQASMFYIPHMLFKVFEAGKLKSIIFGLNNYVLDNEERHSKEEELATYIQQTKGTHNEWCLKILLAQILYLVNVIGQIFFTDCFLGYEFSTYGVHAASFLEEKAENRIDPMSKVFPRVTKCTFKKFGPSGTLQTHDAQCVLPINIINEKIYVFLWFWFCILTVMTIFQLFWTLAIIFVGKARRIILRRKLRLGYYIQKLNYRLTPRLIQCFSFSKRGRQMKIDIPLIARKLKFGDWKLVYHLLK